MFGLLRHCKYQQMLVFRRPPGSSQGSGLRPATCLHASQHGGAVQRAPSLSGMCWEGSVWELAVQIRSRWCKIPIPVGSRGARVWNQSTGWFTIQLLFFLLALQVPAEWLCREELWPKSTQQLNLPVSLAGAGKPWEQLPL